MPGMPATLVVKLRKRSYCGPDVSAAPPPPNKPPEPHPTRVAPTSTERIVLLMRMVFSAATTKQVRCRRSLLAKTWKTTNLGEGNCVPDDTSSGVSSSYKVPPGPSETGGPAGIASCTGPPAC